MDQVGIKKQFAYSTINQIPEHGEGLKRVHMLPAQVGPLLALGVIIQADTS